MIRHLKATFLCGTLTAASCLVLGAGCKDERIDRAPSAQREVKVDAPGVGVKVDVPTEAPAVPRAANELDVDVGPGGVQVDVDGQPLRDRLRERREEKQSATP